MLPRPPVFQIEQLKFIDKSNKWYYNDNRITDNLIISGEGGE